MRLFSAILLSFVLLSGFTPFEKEANESKEGRKKYSEGNMEGAKEEFTNASKRLENNAESFYNIGNSMLKSGDNEGALNAYRKSLETGSADPLLKSYIFHNMGNSLAAMQKYKEAEEFYIRSLLEKPHEDTAENLEIVRRIIEQQQEQQEQNKDQNKDPSEEQDKEQSEEQNKEQDNEQKEEQSEEQKEEKSEEQKEEQPAKEEEKEEKEEDKKDETMMQQFRQRKNLQISPFMLKKEERSKNGQTW